MRDYAHRETGTADSPSRSWGKPLIVAAAVAAIFSLWLFVLIQSQYEASQAMKAEVRENHTRLVALEQYILRTLDAANLAIDHIVGTYLEGRPPVGISPGNPLPAPLEDRVIADAPFEAANIVAKDGSTIASSAPRRDLEIELGDRPEFGKMSISPLPSSKGDGKFILITRAIHTKSFDGYVNLLLRPAELVRVSNEVPLRPEDKISIIGHDGVSIVTLLGSSVSWGERVAGDLLAVMRSSRPGNTYLSSGSLDRTKRHFSYRSLPKYRIFVMSEIDPKPTFGPALARKRMYFTVAGGLSLLIAASAWLLVSGITRRERNVLALSRANARLHEAQRVGSIGDWDYDPGSGQITWSSNLRAMYGRSSDEALSAVEEVARYVGPQDEQKIRDALRHVLATGESQEYSLEARLPNREISFRHIIAAPTYDSDGNITGVHGTDQDVTSARRLEALEARLTQVSRLDAMNLMASTLAHEINQPLSAASNYLAAGKLLLERGPDERTRTAEMLHLSGEQIQQAGKIIRTVREMVSGEAAARVVISVESLVASARKALPIGAFASPHDLTLETGPGAEAVEANAVQAQQVLLNLFRNALHAAGTRHPVVSVTTSATDDGMMTIAIKDNGTGIDGHAADLFTAFSTSKVAGLGLGLLICRTIVEGHGGRIWVDATSRAGTTICFTLPREGSSL